MTVGAWIALVGVLLGAVLAAFGWLIKIAFESVRREIEGLVVGLKEFSKEFSKELSGQSIQLGVHAEKIRQLEEAAESAREKLHEHANHLQGFVNRVRMKR